MGDYKCAGCGKPIHCFTDDWDGCKACGCITAEKVRETEKPAMTDNMQRARWVSSHFPSHRKSKDL